MLDPSSINFEHGFLEAEDREILLTHEHVWILGRRFDSKEFEQISTDIYSKTWFTYRRNFAPIGGTGPTSDQGWGCMLRCGQMLLAQALINRHLGRDWCADAFHKEPKYCKILQMFQDKKSACYSIHQIGTQRLTKPSALSAKAAVPELVENALTNWTATHDTHLRVAACMTTHGILLPFQCCAFSNVGNRMRSMVLLYAKMGETEGKAIGEWFGPSTIAHVIKKLAVHDDWSSLAVHVAMDNIIFLDDVVRTCRSSAFRQNDTADGSVNTSRMRGTEPAEGENGSSKHAFEWRPLLLLVPLRLGLTQLNSCYVPALLEMFKSPNSLGMLGGRPNHALYFIGNFGENLLYLDPHICQTVVDLTVEGDTYDDSSYHTMAILHMPVGEIDPSVALAFFFAAENEFSNFCDTVRSLKARTPCTMFEIMASRPENWPPFVPYDGDYSAKPSDFLVLDNTGESDDDFEVLN